MSSISLLFVFFIVVVFIVLRGSEILDRLVYGVLVFWVPAPLLWILCILLSFTGGRMGDEVISFSRFVRELIDRWAFLLEEQSVENLNELRSITQENCRHHSEVHRHRVNLHI